MNVAEVGATLANEEDGTTDNDVNDGKNEREDMEQGGTIDEIVALHTIYENGEAKRNSRRDSAINDNANLADGIETINLPAKEDREDEAFDDDDKDDDDFGDFDSAPVLPETVREEKISTSTCTTESQSNTNDGPAWDLEKTRTKFTRLFSDHDYTSPEVDLGKESYSKDTIDSDIQPREIADILATHEGDKIFSDTTPIHTWLIEFLNDQITKISLNITIDDGTRSHSHIHSLHTMRNLSAQRQRLPLKLVSKDSSDRNIMIDVVTPDVPDTRPTQTSDVIEWNALPSLFLTEAQMDASCRTSMQRNHVHNFMQKIPEISYMLSPSLTSRSRE